VPLIARFLAPLVVAPMPHARVPRHVARLVTQLVAPLVVDYFA
jgi:hypothetical protein